MTKTKTEVQEVVRPALPETLKTLQFLRTAKGKSDADIHKMLDSALKECKKNDMVLLLERLMIHVGDVSRQHNALTELGIKSDKGGAQERTIFRSILRWWAVKMPESFKKNIQYIVDFTVLENVMFYQNTTDRFKGKVLATEMSLPNPEVVYEFLAGEIRKGKNLNLIAKHLPKHETGKSRTTKKVIKPKAGKESYVWKLPEGKSWVKVNGVKIDAKTIELKKGDVVSYPRAKQGATITRQSHMNDWISGFCKHMGWDIDMYKKFRTKQSTAEQKMSSKSILTLSKADFMLFLDSLTSGQRFRVAKSLCYKDGEKLVPREKWGKLGSYYVEWENNQEVVVQKLREVSVTDDAPAKAKLMKELKVKATGIQTIDLLVKMLSGSETEQMINNTHQAMLEKMDLIANVFPIIDGSGSMNNGITSEGRGTNAVKVDERFARISRYDVAAAMCITFSTRNPVQAFRNTFGWFSNNFTIIGKSKFVNDAPNSYVNSREYTKKVNEYDVLSETVSFTDNMKAMKRAPGKGEVASTNMFASIEHFVKLVNSGHLHAEDLPTALLYITDNENNSGKSPKQALELAYTIGWHPLLIFWGLTKLPDGMSNDIKNLDNVLLIGGFNESVLSQVLRGIRSGSVNPEDEIWSLFEDKRYSVIK